jgi:hypothetical protein
MSYLWMTPWVRKFQVRFCLIVLVLSECAAHKGSAAAYSVTGPPGFVDGSPYYGWASG